ncbi:bifunctional phosphatase PAP2/diacylglycerol kinase family protein [Streptomyces sp. TP-A0356]|uniref:bifunctional phosphatase PAP2/diacylglycerol kinase family protein n=1 Tax=Streptomyces sp. TP-A0356 TaxID=1359208 RepID=UPI0006E1C54C|nr:bifunctional phosphatase PAP2/diacylglycerol kinase family protein [Streptomyces sp. TP-A0356]
MRFVGELDRRLFTRVAAAHVPGADRVLTRLSRSADHGLLWLGMAGCLAALGGRTARRAALRGTGSLVLASLTVNTFVKWTARRPRPVLVPVPSIRRLTRQPHTTSFPSGHSASAAAFATGVALESTRYGALVAPVAAAVAFSRVYVGVHYPGDVLAGVAIGAGAALLTCRSWPPRQVNPERERPPAQAPALPEGEGLVVFVNSRAGTAGPAAALPPAALLAELLPRAELVECGPEDDFATLLDRAVHRAAERGGALGVYGGDGTVNAAARAAAPHGLALAVFPGGTLNHFALDVGVPHFEDTADAVVRGEAVAVDIAVAAPMTGRGPRADPIEFLNTFSIGLYPDLVQLRERLERRWGKWPAAAVALIRVLRTATPVELSLNGRPRRLWLLFAGNCRYVPDGFAPAFRPRLDDGLLELRMVDGDHRLARTRVVVAALAGALGRSRVYHAERVSWVRAEGLRGTDTFAYDGEVAPATDALLLEKRHRALVVYRPVVQGNEIAQQARLAAAAARHRGRERGRPLPADGGPSDSEN